MNENKVGTRIREFFFLNILKFGLNLVFEGVNVNEDVKETVSVGGISMTKYHSGCLLKTNDASCKWNELRVGYLSG